MFRGMLICIYLSVYLVAVSGTKSVDKWDIVLVETGSRDYDLFANEVSQFASTVTISAAGRQVSGPSGKTYIVLDELAKRKGNILKVQYSPSRIKLYASATCVTSEGGVCGFQAMLIEPDVGNHISWIPYTTLMHPQFSHVEWHLLCEKEDLTPSDIGMEISVSYVTANNNCETSYGSCDSMCFNGKCGVKRHFHELECHCNEKRGEQSKSSIEVGTEIAAIVICSGCVISIGSVVAWWICIRDKRNNTDVETHADAVQSPHISHHLSREEIEVAVDSLLVHFTKSTPNDTQSCCVCLVTNSENCPDNNNNDDWITTPCSHTMHGDCLRLWLVQRLTKTQSMSCPVCRTTVCVHLL